MSDWIEWKAIVGMAEVPVSPDTLVDYKLRDGYEDTQLAKNLEWDAVDDEGDDTDIIAYRIVEEGK